MSALPRMASIGWARAAYGADRGLCIAALALLGVGLVMVASASVAVAEKSTGTPLYYFYKQASFAVVGLVAAAVVYMVPIRNWENTGFWLLTFAFLLLMLVLIPGVGVKVNESRRWLDLGLFRLQASEPARLALVLYLVGYATRRRNELQNSFKGLMKPLIPVVLASVLLMLEPDFGATALLFAVAMLVLFLAGARVLDLLALGAVAGIVLTGLVLTASYRLQRLMSFTDPFADIENSGWQLAQSLIAIGRGEWTGVGLGNSLQKLLYLPETHTDFIFAIWSEEFGLAGVVALMLLFGVLVWRMFSIGRVAEERMQTFSGHLCYAMGGWLGLQTLINVAVNMGLLPTKGLTLPLISYGGSSLITVCLMVALVLRVDHENRMSSAGSPVGGLRRL